MGEENNNTLVILLNFLDSTDVPFSKAEASNLIFNGQFYKFMKEQSFNKANFYGDVFGWLTLERQSANNGCYVGDMQYAIDDFAKQNNIDISKYEHLLYVLNCEGNYAGGISSVGKYNMVLGGIKGYASHTEVYISKQSALADSYHTSSDIVLPFSWTNFDNLLSHELGGHALGVWHANGWDCGDNAVTLPCSHIEYGSIYDVMGSGDTFALHFNGHYKNLLGWLSTSEVLNIDKTGNYQISALESNASGATSITKKLAYIKLPGKTEPAYSIEYRAPIGFDAELVQSAQGINRSGLYIHKINNYKEGGSTNQDPEIIDAKPTSLPWHLDGKDVVLKGLGDVFSDPKAGLIIKPLALSQSGDFLFKVEIKPTSCIPLPPELNPTMFEQTTGTSGNYLYLSEEVTNADYSICPPSDFYTEILPNPIFTLYSGSHQNKYNVTPNTQFLSNISAKINQSIAPGEYQYEIKSTNVTTGLSTTEVRNVTITQ